MNWRNVVFTVTPGVLFYQAVTCQRLWSHQVRRMLEHLPSSPVRDVLDLGCGAGASAFELATQLGDAASVTAVDVSPKMLGAARRALAGKFAHLSDRVRFVEADAHRLPFPDASFDVVTGHSFLYLVARPEAVLSEVRRVLRPGGRLVLMEPADEGSLSTALLPVVRQVDALSAPWAGLRFLFALVHWRMLASVVGTLSRGRAAPWFTAAGYTEVVFEPTLAGLGWHVRADA